MRVVQLPRFCQFTWLHFNKMLYQKIIQELTAEKLQPFETYREWFDLHVQWASSTFSGGREWMHMLNDSKPVETIHIDE